MQKTLPLNEMTITEKLVVINQIWDDLIDIDTVYVYAVLDCRKNLNRTIEDLKQRLA
jgi:hypothetical protein